jgi:hypothetical protein
VVACRIYRNYLIACFAYEESGCGYFLLIFLDFLRWEGWIGFSSAWACGVEKGVTVVAGAFE